MSRGRCSRLSFLLSIGITLFSIAVALDPLGFDLATSVTQQTGNCRPGLKAICLLGSASMAADVLQLTSMQKNDTGWAYYSEPLHLWDKSTRALTNFTTTFAIDIQAADMAVSGDGIAFFLLPYPFVIPPNSGEDYLGLVNKLQENSTTGLIAVEFDTDFLDYGPDPAYLHIGIDINSLTSVKTEPLYAVNNNIRGNATVSYDASSHNLTVIFLDALKVGREISLWYVVDLREYLPDSVVVGLSGSTDYLSPETNRITSWVFSSPIESVATTGNLTTPNVVIDPSTNNKRQYRTLFVAAIAVGVMLIVAMTGMGLFVLQKKMTNTRSTGGTIVLGRRRSIDEELARDKGPRSIPYTQLVAATENFSKTRELGSGGFGAVYKGFLPDLNFDVAIKRFCEESKQGTKEYIAEVKTISKLQHKNLVPLVGWCHEDPELLLVYQYMPNGSLDTHLFDGKDPLVWPLRYKIAQGLASALLYLQTEWEKCVVHRDIKPSNIMLDSSFNARLGDFGLARLADHGSEMLHTTSLAGSFGYMAPECVVSGSSKESDIYSFGIVLLEIACGRTAVGRTAEDGKEDLLKWIWDLYEAGQVLEAADPRLKGKFDEDQMRRLVSVGLWCASSEVASRPSIEQASAALSFDFAPTPNLSRRRPMSMSVSSIYSVLSINTTGKWSIGQRSDNS